jgi:hypothetical protein
LYTLSGLPAVNRIVRCVTGVPLLLAMPLSCYHRPLIEAVSGEHVGATELTVPNTAMFFYDLLLDLPFLNYCIVISAFRARRKVFPLPTEILQFGDSMTD